MIRKWSSTGFGKSNFAIKLVEHTNNWLTINPQVNRGIQKARVTKPMTFGPCCNVMIRSLRGLYIVSLKSIVS